jgi:hypothetical protein
MGSLGGVVRGVRWPEGKDAASDQVTVRHMGGAIERGVVDTVAGQVARIRTHRKGCVVTGQVLQGVWQQVRSY